MTNLRSIIILVLSVATPVLLFSQSKSAFDSLTNQLQQYDKKDSLRIDILNQLAYELYLNGPQKALELAYEARILAKEINYAKGEAQACRQIGLVSWAQANFPLALNHFLEGLKIAEGSNDLQTVADITGNLGLVYFALGDYTQSLGYQEKSLTMQRQLKNKAREAVALNNLGDIKRTAKEYHEAIDLYSMALQLREEANNLAGQATNIRNIGNVYEDQGIFNKALDQYFKSMKISDGEDEKRGMSQSRYSIASVYFKMNLLNKAKVYALTSLEIAKQADYRASIRDSYSLLSQITEAQKDIRESFEFFKLYSAYRDSVVNLQVASEIASQRLEYETQKKQVEIDLLKKNAELSELDINKKNSLLIFIGITVVLLVLLIAILLRNYSKQKSINKILENKNEEIVKQRSEITEQRDKLIALNEEISAQQEELVASHNALALKNASIAEMNQKILEINESLEKTVTERTSALEKQNQQLIEYAFLNAHKLRAPLARILGLVNLVTLTPQNEERKKLMHFLMQASTELDEVVKSIGQVVQEGLDVYKKEI